MGKSSGKEAWEYAVVGRRARQGAGLRAQGQS